jgi:hypothetical protein
MQVTTGKYWYPPLIIGTTHINLCLVTNIIVLYYKKILFELLPITIVMLKEYEFDDDDNKPDELQKDGVVML